MPDRSLAEHLAWQADVLPQVSRTFALTIPQLPDALANVVGNAYLLCRIADAIEDDENVSIQTKHELHWRFIALFDDAEPVAAFVRDASAALTESTIAAERHLVANTDRALAITRSFDATCQAAIKRCVDKMCRGMPQYQHAEKAGGLATMADMNRYCYFVAGVVGEMLTDLFCAHAPDIHGQRDNMRRLDASFGQGLQMTNILKDVWEDAASGSCWLPRDLFAAAGYDLTKLAPEHNRAAFNEVLQQLVAEAHGHLRNALSYALLIPPAHRGVRLFCLWSIGLALLTLRRIVATPDYACADDVKVSRRSVALVVATTRACAGSDGALRFLFTLAARSLPERVLPAQGTAERSAGDAMVSSHHPN